MMRRAFGIDPADIEREIAGKLETNLAVLGLATPENLGLLLNLLGIEPPAGALRGSMTCSSASELATSS